jgi:hypothetical protein
MTSQTDIPLSFWGYALETAVFTLNRVPSMSVEKTPHEIWIRKHPRLSFLKVWGCEAEQGRRWLAGFSVKGGAGLWGKGTRACWRRMELDLVMNGGGGVPPYAAAHGEVAQWWGKDGGKPEGWSLAPEERSASSWTSAGGCRRWHPGWTEAGAVYHC